MGARQPGRLRRHARRLRRAVRALDRARPARRPSARGHPRLAILGLLEARLLGFDLTLLGGLDETIWPPAAQTDAFLNRPMRAALGLSSPERRIGQTAHDFIAALGAPRRDLSRAKKRGGAPTVASRFLQRMGAVAGEDGDARDARRAASDISSSRARSTDPRPPAPIERPGRGRRWNCGRRELSVTRIETLRRDPYAIYRRANPRPRAAGADRRRTRRRARSATCGMRRCKTSAEQRRAPSARKRPRAHDVDRRARICAAQRRPRVSRHALAAHRARARGNFSSSTPSGAPKRARLWFERSGALEIEYRRTASTFTLDRARRPHRDLARRGAAIIDYKTGAPPGPNEVKVGFAPQLTLEAAMLARGAFAESGRRDRDGSSISSSAAPTAAMRAVKSPRTRRSAKSSRSISPG